MIEILESRQMLSGDPVFQVTSKKTLIVQGTNLNDEIFVQPSSKLAGRLLIQVFADRPNTDVTITHQILVHADRIKRIYIAAGDGDDFVNIFGSSVTLPVVALGEGGNDQMTSSAPGRVMLDGGDGNDQLYSGAPNIIPQRKNRDAIHNALATVLGGAASNTLLGEAGDDTLRGDSNDHLDGGAGNDTAKVFVQTTGFTFATGQLEGLVRDYYAYVDTAGIEGFASF